MTDPILASLPDDANIDPPSWLEGAPHADRDRSDRPVSTPSGLAAGLEGQGATQEVQDATEAAQRRVERYAEPIHEYWCEPCCDGPCLIGNECRTVARAVIAVADQEQAELRAERDLAMACWKSDMRSYHAAKSRAEAAEARVAELEATVARVRAKVDGQIPLPYCQADSRIIVGLIRDVRAILDGPDAPCPTCSGPIRETVGLVCQTCGHDYGPPAP